MQSVEIPVVTQTRVSGDYSPSNSQWMIGDTSIIAHAIGLAVFKDVRIFIYVSLDFVSVCLPIYRYVCICAYAHDHMHT